MKEKTKYKIAIVTGMAVIMFSILLYRQGSEYWYFPAPIGTWLFLNALFYFRGGQATLGLILTERWKSFLLRYGIFFVLGISIELIGSVALNLWSYKLASYTPTLNAIYASTYTHPVDALGWFIYPFMLMQFIELYGFINSFFKNVFISTVLSMIMGILIWEIPNVYSRDWVYSIPFVHLSILGINIVVILGWVILIQMPLQVSNFLNRLRAI